MPVPKWIITQKISKYVEHIMLRLAAILWRGFAAFPFFGKHFI